MTNDFGKLNNVGMGYLDKFIKEPGFFSQLEKQIKIDEANRLSQLAQEEVKGVKNIKPGEWKGLRNISKLAKSPLGRTSTATLGLSLLHPFLEMNRYTWAPDQKLLNEIYKNVGREDLIKDVTKPSQLYKMGPAGAILQGSIEKIVNDINNGSTVYDNKSKQEEQNGGNTNINKSSSNNNLSSNGLPNLPAIANQILNESSLAGATTRALNEDDINILNDYLKQLQDTTQPYIDSLERYKKNYFKNLDQARRADLYFYGANLAKGLNPKAGEKFNPLQNQADVINTIKLIGEAKANQINAINELQGNIALAKEMDLPAEAAFGNKNLLTALSQAKKYATDLEKARIMDAMRRYGYDTSYNRAIDQQRLRNQGNRDVANIYMGGGVVPGIGLNQQGTAQQQTYSPIAQRQSAEQNYYKQILGY